MNGGVGARGTVWCARPVAAGGDEICAHQTYTACRIAPESCAIMIHHEPLFVSGSNGPVEHSASDEGVPLGGEQGESHVPLAFWLTDTCACRVVVVVRRDGQASAAMGLAYCQVHLGLMIAVQIQTCCAVLSSLEHVRTLGLFLLSIARLGFATFDTSHHNIQRKTRYSLVLC